MSLQDFLKNNLIDGLTFQSPISSRIKDKDGNLLDFTYGVLDPKEYESIRKKGMKVNVKKKDVDINTMYMNEQIVISASIDPDFKDAKSIQSIGCQLPEEYLRKVLLPGEIETYANKIKEDSGFNQDIEDLKSEAKN